ncbi:MAG: hypothetical protein ACRDI2_06805 [Chloroflexota bacterium]
MASITGSLVDYLLPELREEEGAAAQRLASYSSSVMARLENLESDRALLDSVRQLLVEPAPWETFNEAIDHVREGEGGKSLAPPETLGLTVSAPPGAGWVAVGIPIFADDELDALLADWHRLDGDAFTAELRVGTWWEALRTVDGRWALLPQDRFPLLNVALPVLIGYSTRVVFERVAVHVLADDLPPAGGPISGGPEQQCALQADKQEPNLPYVGSCGTRGCHEGCRDLTGTGSGGHKVLLACEC